MENKKIKVGIAIGFWGMLIAFASLIVWLADLSGFKTDNWLATVAMTSLILRFLVWRRDS